MSCADRKDYRPDRPRVAVRFACAAALILAAAFTAVHAHESHGGLDSLEIARKSVTGKERVRVLLELSSRLSENRPEESARHATEAMHLADSLHLTAEHARAINLLGLYHYGQGRFEIALEYFLTVLRVAENIADKAALSMAYTNIGHIYTDIGLHDSAIVYYKRDLAIHQGGNDVASLATAYNNIGLIQDEKGDSQAASASFRRSLELTRQCGDRGLEGIVLNNIGDMLLNARKYEEALEHFKMAKSIADEVDDRFTLAIALHNCGLAMRGLRKFDESVRFLSEALAVNQKLGAEYALLDDTRELAHTYAEMGNHKVAYDYLKRHDTLSDRIFSVETGKKIAEIQNRRQMELREHENQFLRKSEELREVQGKQALLLRNALILGILLVCVLGLVVYNRFQLKKRSEMAFRARTEELEAVDKLVKTINHEVSVERLYRALLELGRTLFPQADKAAVLIYDDASDGFRVLSSFGMEPGGEQTLLLPSPVLAGDWVKNVARVEKIGEGISIFHFRDATADTDDCSGRCPRSRLVLDIEMDHRISGILLFDNFSRTDAFKSSEIERWVRFREHAIAALIKAKLLEDAQSARLAAEEASSIKTRLLSIASHDLKNPLSVIIGISEIIESEASEDDKTRDLAGMIRDSGNRMLSLLYDLLDMSELEMGKIILNFRAVDVIPLVESVVYEHRPLAERKRQKLELTLGSAGPLHVMADEKRLREAVANLVDNAIKFSPLDSYIHVTVVKLDKVRIEVRDEGPGLTERDKSLIFGQFQRLSARPTGGEPSTGVGLSIVKQVIELHGGHVSVDSEEGKGATFIIEV